MTLFLLPLVVSLAAAPSETPTGKMPSDAAKLTEAFRQEAESIQREADARIQARRDALVEKLQSMQDTYTKAAMLDEAVAIRNQIRQLQAASLIQKQVEVLWGDRWWAAEVLQAKDNKSFVHYTGYDDHYNEWVTPDRIRFSSRAKNPVSDGTAQKAPLMEVSDRYAR